jgi:hypothetical protein
MLVGDNKTNRWHLQIAQRWVVQYNFYINDRQWGRMFVRICPYLPFSARVCLNQHHWLANQMRQKGIDFKQCANAFISCSAPQRLQQLADTLTPWDLLTCGQKWLGRLTWSITSMGSRIRTTDKPRLGNRASRSRSGHCPRTRSAGR